MSFLWHFFWELRPQSEFRITLDTLYFCMVLYSQLKANVIFTNFAGKNSQEVSVFLNNYPVSALKSSILYVICRSVNYTRLLMEYWWSIFHTILEHWASYKCFVPAELQEFSQSSLVDLDFNLAAGETGLVSVCNQWFKVIRNYFLSSWEFSIKHETKNLRHFGILR